MAGAEPVAKRSDLGVRTASAVVMLAVAGAALWLGGWWWTVLVMTVAAGVLYEWRALVRAFPPGLGPQAAWTFGGVVYLALAAAMLMFLRNGEQGLVSVLAVIAMVVATDVGAYFSGRTFGGPKIAPAISPSKTWAGLFGGMLASAAAIALVTWFATAGAAPWRTLVVFAAGGAGLAVVAQAGDFCESWMKRRAGVKDSSHLIPGHGGLFDRVDGLLAVSFLIGVLFIVGRLAGLP